MKCNEFWINDVQTDIQLVTIALESIRGSSLADSKQGTLITECVDVIKKTFVYCVRLRDAPEMIIIKASKGRPASAYGASA